MEANYYFKGKLLVSNSDISVEFTINCDRNKECAEDPREQLVQKVVFYAIDFSNEHGFDMPFDYICDSMNRDYEDEQYKEVYVSYLDSNIINQDDFDIQWGNYMKAFGRNRF